MVGRGVSGVVVGKEGSGVVACKIGKEGSGVVVGRGLRSIGM